MPLPVGSTMWMFPTVRSAGTLLPALRKVPGKKKNRNLGHRRSADQGADMYPYPTQVLVIGLGLGRPRQHPPPRDGALLVKWEGKGVEVEAETWGYDGRV